MSDAASDARSDPASDAGTGDAGRDSSSDPERLFLLSSSDCSESDWRCTRLFTGRSLPESSAPEPSERRGLSASLPERFLPVSDSLSDAMRFLWTPSSSESEPLSLCCLQAIKIIFFRTSNLRHIEWQFLLSSFYPSSAIFSPSSSEESEEEMMALDLILPLRDGGRRSGLD